MAAFVADSFVDTPNKYLENRGWVMRSGLVLIDSTGAKATTQHSTGAAYYLPTVEPPSPDYAVRAMIDLGAASNAALGLTARNRTDEATYYYARALYNNVKAHQLYRAKAGVLTLLADTGSAITPTGPKAAELRVVTNGATVEIEWWWDGALVLSYTDTHVNRITDAGYPGLAKFAGTRNASTWDDFEAEVIGAVGETGVLVAVEAGPDALSAAGGIGPVITTVLLADGQVSAPYSQTLSALGSGPISWTVVAGALPAWASLNGATGEIAGTPDAPALSAFTIRASNAYGTYDRTLSILVPNLMEGGGEFDPVVGPVEATEQTSDTFVATGALV